MCGIAGFISEDRPANSTAILQKMADLMKHRGPDSEGFYEDNAVGFAHRRLQIVDRSELSNQPMTDSDTGCVLNFNGEIYNFSELREELRRGGWHFHSKSDTEVLLKGLVAHGERFIERLEGDFAFAFRNPRQGVTLIARDRFGVKPLYIAKQNKTLWFSSEIKPLFAAGVSKSINSSLLAEYFRYRYIGGSETLFENISHFPPGHFLRIQNNNEVLVQYYAIAENSAQRREFSGVFQDAVRERISADVPAGLLLSSGIDSASIAAQAAKLGDRLSTFTYSFVGSKTDESRGAAHIAEDLNLPHTTVKSVTEDWTFLPAIIQSLEEPIGDLIIVANDSLFSAAKKKVGVVLSGEGADEIFSSYAHHRAFRILKSVKANRLTGRLASLVLGAAPLFILNKLSFYPAKLDMNLKIRVGQALRSSSDAAVFRCLSSLFNEDELKMLLKDNYREDRDFFQGTVFATDMKNWLPKYGLLRIDKLSMAHSLEVRVPFLSHRVVESAVENGWSNPSAFCRDKANFRAFCLRTLGLPRRIVFSRKIPFFNPGLAAHSDAYTQYVNETLSPARVNQFKILNADYVQSMTAVKNPDFLLAKKIASLLVFQLWCEAFFA